MPAKSGCSRASLGEARRGVGVRIAVSHAVRCVRRSRGCVVFAPASRRRPVLARLRASQLAFELLVVEALGAPSPITSPSRISTAFRSSSIPTAR